MTAGRPPASEADTPQKDTPQKLMHLAQAAHKEARCKPQSRAVVYHLTLSQWQMHEPAIAPGQVLPASKVSGWRSATAVYRGRMLTSAHCPSDMLLKRFCVWCVWSGRTTKYTSTIAAKDCCSMNACVVSELQLMCTANGEALSHGLTR